jgi:hypothetical protein
MKKTKPGEVGEEDLMQVFDPANGEPPLPEGQVPLFEYLIAKIEDPAQKEAAQKALDGRAPVRTLNWIVYRKPNDDEVRGA